MAEVSSMNALQEMLKESPHSTRYLSEIFGEKLQSMLQDLLEAGKIGKKHVIQEDTYLVWLKPTIQGETMPPPGTPSSQPNHVDPQSPVEGLKEKLNMLKRQLQHYEGSESDRDAYIQKLHEYNDLKDIGQMLMGKLAESEGLVTRDMYERFDMDLGD
eukprot:GILJ01015151.1.p1 GENE.GILJ01015151.1~~GILJ01015151.1.p1  ORF type:complete len:167 (-),score=23.56 GILJ01015151.1:266-739(-)